MPKLLNARQPKPVRWVAGSKEDLSRFPDDVKRRMGFALYEAQTGHKAPFAKPMKGYAGAGVLEVVDDFDGDTFRAVYTVRLAEVVYVLHAFQKKSKRGIATPRAEMVRINQRLRAAAVDYKQWLERERAKSR